MLTTRAPHVFHAGMGFPGRDRCLHSSWHAPWPLLLAAILFASATSAYAESPQTNLIEGRITALVGEAMAGSVDARFELGDIFSDGTKRDPAQAVWWYQQAAELGHVRAQYALAKLHAQGLGTPPNWVVADKWMTLAANAGDVEASADRSHLELAMTLKARMDAFQLARAWKVRQASASLVPVIAGGTQGKDTPTPGKLSVSLNSAFPLSNTVPFYAKRFMANARAEHLAFFGKDYRAEFMYLRIDAGYQLTYTIESLGLWDFFSNFRLQKVPGSGQANSAIGSIEYRRLTLEDKSTCIYFTHAWPSGHMDYPPAARWGDDEHNDRLMNGYLCARQRQPLTDSEITTFFANLKVTDVDED